MGVGQQRRRELQEALVDQIGPGPADTMMDHLPPAGWADVATRQDLEAHEAATKTSLDTLQAVLHTEINELGTELRSEMKQLRSDVQTDIHRELRLQFYWTMTLFALLLAAFTATIKWL